MKTHPVLKTTLALLVSLAPGLAARAATDTWTGGSSATGNWSDSANWGGTAPNPTGDTFILTGSTQPVNTNDTVTASSWILLNPSTGFSIYGNGITNSAGITNTAQNNILNLAVGIGGSQTIAVAAGSSLAVSNLINAGNYTTLVTGGGALSLFGSSVNLAGLGGTAFFATNLGTFNYTNSAGTLNFTVATSATATTNRLGTNVNVTASVFGVGDGGPAGSGTSQTDYLYLGQTNVINAGTIYAGYNGAATGNSYLRFGPGFVNPSLTIAGVAGGTNRANLTVGETYSSDYASGQGTLDLTNGVTGSTLNAYLGNVVIGYRTIGGGNYANSGTGTFVFGAGTLDATSILLGQADTKDKTGSGTLTVNGGTVKTVTLTLGNQTAAVSAGAVSANGTLNANPGSLIAAALITSGAGASGGSTNVRTINFNGATLANYNSTTSLEVSNLTVTLSGSYTNTLAPSAGEFIAFTNNAKLAGTGGFVVNGAGTVQLFGTNTYSGNTTISNGTLALLGYTSISNTPLISVAGGATLDVSGLTNTFTLGSTQTLSNRASATGNLNGNFNTGSGVISLSYASGTPALNLNSGTLTLSSGTVFTINNTGAQLPIGNYVLISTNAGAVITGTAPSVTITGGGVAAGWGLAITNGVLELQVFGRQDTWTGGGTPSGNWSNAANWGGTAPDPAGDSLVFTGSTQPLNTNDTVSALISVQLNTGTAFTLSGNPVTLVAGITNAGGNNTWNIPLTLTANQPFSVASGTTLTLGGGESGGFALTKTGSGTLAITGADTRTGNTVVSAGTLALSGSGSLANSSLITLAGGTTLNVSGLSGGFALGGGQTLSNTASATANVIGSLTTGTGTLSLSYVAGTPALAVSGGTLTLSSGTVFNVNNTGSALAAGTYVLIATNAGGLVAGTVPAVAVTGGGVAAGVSLVITNGQLDLVLATQTDTWTGGSGTSANWSDAANWGGTAPNPFGDSLIFAGSTQPVNTNNSVSTVGGILLNPGAAFTFYGNAVTVNSAVTNSAANNVFYTALALGGSVDFDVATNTTLTLSNTVSGAAIVKTSPGTLDLGYPANTFTGAVTVAAGTLQLGYLGAASASGTYTFPGSSLSVNNANLYFNGYNGGGAIVDTYAFPNLTGTIGVTNSTVSFASGSSTTKAVNAPVSFGGTNTIVYTSTGYTHVLDFNGSITGTGSLVFNWNGTTTGRSIAVNTSGNNFTGTVLLGATPTAGNFNLNYPLGPVAYVVSNSWQLVNGPTNDLDNATAVTLVSSGAGLNLTTYGWSNSAAVLTVNAGAVILGNSTTGTALTVGTLAGTGGVITNSGTMPSTVTVAGTNSSTYAGVIADDGGAPLALTLAGTGTLTLSGANLYAGNTTVNAGTLNITGTLASPAVTVNTNGTLGGTGSLSGSVQVNAGGTLSAVENSTLSLNGLTFGTNPGDHTMLTVEGDGTTVAGNVAVTGGGVVNNGVVTVNVTGALPSGIATYTLLTYAGTSSGSGTYVAGSLTSGLTGYITNNASASAIQLVVTGSDYLRWAGSPTNDWDLTGAAVWVYGSTGLPGAFANSQSAVFDDTAANFTVNLAAAVAPGGVNFSNSANNYVLGGSGKITGGTTLTMNGTGNLTVTTTNDYTGLTTVNGGTLQLGDGTAHNGSVAGAIADNAAVTFANPGAQSYAGGISGSGAVTKTGAGALTVGGTNSYNGLTTISAGTLVAGSSTALGSPAAGTTVASGATLDVGGQNLGAEAVTIAGTGVGGNGAVVNSGAQQTQALQSLALTANSTIGGSNRWDLRDGGSGATLNLNGDTLTKTGTNAVFVVGGSAGATVSDGNIVVNQGEFGFQVGTVFPQGAGTITVNPAGTLGVSDWGTPLQVNQPIYLNGGTLLADAGGTTATLGSPVTMTTNSVITVNCPLTMTNFIGGTGNLTVDGSSSLVLDASNVWSGSLFIASNTTVQIGNNDLNGYLPATVGVVTNNGLLAYAVSSDLVFTQAMVGSGGLEQAGYNTISITNVQSYTGKTVLANSGTLLLGAGNNTLSNATVVSFTGSGTLNLQTNSQQISGLTMNGTLNGYIEGAATLSVIKAADLRLGSTGNTTPTLDMYTLGLDAFTYDEPTNIFSVGGQATAADSAGTVSLALTNVITANRFGIADFGGYPGYTSSGTLNLGVLNAIDANTILVGCGSTGSGGWAATATLDFASGANNPVLVVRNAAGTGRANITIGYAAASDYSAGNGTVDLYDNVTGASTVDILAGNLIIGQHTYKNVNYSEAATGTLTMGNGILNATNLILGQKTANGGLTGASANGTFTQNAGLVTVNAILVGDQQYTNGASVTGTYNLNGGTLEAQTITAGTGNATRTINWNGGTLENYTNSNLTVTGVGLTVNGGATVCALDITAGQTGNLAGSLSGGAPLVSLGTGTVLLDADESGYSGTVTNAAGTLYANGPMASGTIETLSGAVLGGTNTVGTVNVDAGGILQPGSPATNGMLTTYTLNLGGAGATADVTYSRFDVAAGTAVTTSTLNANGTNRVTILGPLTTVGTNSLIYYSGSIGGNGIAGFKLASLPSGVSAYLQDNPGYAVQLVVTSLLNTTPTNITSSVSGSTLTLGWPADHTGWRLEVQTNNLTTGISANPADWGTVSGSTATNQESITIDPTKPTEFYRLVYP